MNIKKILITGGTGFIGSNLARQLLKCGHQVNILVRPNHKEWRIKDIREKLVIHKMELSDHKNLNRTFKRIKPDWIFHLAVYGAYSHQEDLQEMIATNITGVSNLVQAGLKIGFESFINVGSSSEYGFKDHAPSEKEWLDPNSHYALTKAYATMFCRYTAISQKVNIVTLRPYSVYGPYEEPTRFLPTLIIKGIDKKLPVLVSEKIARDYVYVDDFVAASILAASSKHQELGAIYNVGTGEQTTIKEAIEAASKIFEIKEQPCWGSMNSRIWDTNTWICKNDHIKGSLGWKPKYSFAEGFLKMAEWFKSDPEMLWFYKKTLGV